MSKLIGPLTFFVIAVCSSANADKYQSFTLLLAQANEQIQQNHQKFSKATQALVKSVHSLCKSPSEDRLTDTRQQWRTTMDSWMTVSVLQFGPLQVDNRRLRIQAWPIRQNLLKRQVSALLRHTEPVTIALIENSSVALQGLPALEHLLYRKNALKLLASGQACLAMMAISRHLTETAKQLTSAWLGEYGETFSHPDNDAKVVTDFIDEYLNGLVTALQQIQRRKLNDPLGLSGKPVKVTALESYLSGTSLANIRANLLAIAAYLRGPAEADKQANARVNGYGITDFLQEHDPEGGTIILLTEQLSAIESSLASLDKPLESFAEDTTFAVQIRRLHQQVTILQTVMEKHVFKELGITRDFNSEDGD